MITKNRYDLEGDTVFQGLSSDTKPTEHVAENSVFLELDTGTLYYYSNGSWSAMA